MEPLQLPDDLIAFLDSSRQLEFEPETCEAGAVTLFPRAALTLRTFGAQSTGDENREDKSHLHSTVQQVPGVDLIASCTGDYDPEGLLIWFPGERSFGVWDPAHDYVLVFGPAVSWSQIANSPARFINAQWDFEDLDRAPAEFLVPPLRYPSS